MDTLFNVLVQNSTDAIIMVDSTQAYNLNTVSKLNSAGNSFSTTFRNSY